MRLMSEADLMSWKYLRSFLIVGEVLRGSFWRPLILRLNWSSKYLLSVSFVRCMFFASSRSPAAWYFSCLFCWCWVNTLSIFVVLVFLNFSLLL